MKKHIIPVLLIFIIAIFSITWFRGNDMICSLFADFTYIINDKISFDSFTIWQDASLGTANYSASGFNLPYGFYLIISNKLGMPVSYSARIWFILNIFLWCFSIYFLIITVYRDKYNSIAGVFGIILFMFNPWNAIFHGFLWTSMSSLPLILGLYIKGLIEKKGSKYIIYICILWMMIGTTGLTSLRAILYSWIVIISFLVYFIIMNTKEKKLISFSLIYTIKFFTLWIVLNSFWFLPQFMNVHNIIQSSANTYNAINLDWMYTFKTTGAAFPDLTRLSGFWALDSSYKGSEYLKWGRLYVNGPISIIGYFIPTIAFISLLVVKRRKLIDTNIVFFVLLSLFSMLAMRGGKYPINSFISKYIYYYAVLFKDPYLYGGYLLLIAYAVLFGIGVSCLMERIKIPIFKAIVAIITICVILTYGFPILTGDLFRKGDKNFGSERYNIPEYWLKTAEYLKNDKSDFRVFTFPYSNLGYMTYTWPPNGFNGANPIPELIGKPVVMGVGKGLKTAELIGEVNEEELCRKLGEINVKYLIHIRDANLHYIQDDPFYGKINSRNINFMKRDKKILKKEITFGEVDIYKIPDKYILGHISLSDNKSIVSYEKISPAKYLVNVVTEKQVRLILNNSYNSGWVATINNIKIQDSKHIIVNEFANGWDIEKTGKYQVLLEFAPQRLFYIGFVVSVITLICSILYLIYGKGKIFGREISTNNC